VAVNVTNLMKLVQYNTTRFDLLLFTESMGPEDSLKTAVRCV